MFKGANIPANLLVPGARAYLPDDLAWKMAQDINLNVLHLAPGIEGDVAGINMNSHPDTWAQKLMNFLNKAESYGLKVILHEMGNPWDAGLGITPPMFNYQRIENFGAVAKTIPEALAMIDKIGGDNNLGHNFFTDPRIPYWQPINEARLDYQDVADWTAALCDAIRGYGGKVSCCVNDGIHRYAESFPYIMPFAEAHFDYLQAHEYGYYGAEALIRSEGAAAQVYQPLYDTFHEKLGTMARDRGSYPIEKVLWTEWGFWNGTMQGPGMSSPLTVTEQQQADYVRAAFDAMRDIGLKNSIYHHLFNTYDFYADRYRERWGVADYDGTPFLAYDAYKTGFTPTPVSPIELLIRAALSAASGIGLILLCARARARTNRHLSWPP